MEVRVSFVMLTSPQPSVPVAPVKKMGVLEVDISENDLETTLRFELFS